MAPNPLCLLSAKEPAAYPADVPATQIGPAQTHNAAVCEKSGLAEMLLAVVEAGKSNLGRSLTAIEAVDLGGNHKRCCVTSRVT